ncbi:MAG: NAD(P)H-dependent oxidoreductase subunit E [Akkermansia sp.]|nr:NAD(P)H-dependent oxidoreductase subunit E [Akkermansia sp.]
MSDTPNAIDAITAAKPSPGEQHFPKFKVTPGLVKEAQALVAQYPEGKEQSAVLPIIHLVQEKFGYICADAMPWIAEMCNSTPIHVAGIVTFYPGIHTMCPGKYHFRVCRTIACSLSGGEELIPYICEKIGVNYADMSDEEPMLVSADGLFSVEPVECLANCGFGPNVMLNEVLYSQVTTKKIDELIAKYQPKQ